MSDQRGARFALAIAAAALLLSPRTGAGQDVSSLLESEAAIERRIEELTAQYLAADAVADAADAAAEGRKREGLEGQDTVFVGPLRIVTTRSQIEQAARFWREEWAYFEPFLGSHAPALESEIFIYHRSPVLFPYEVLSGHLSNVQFKRPVSDARVRSDIRHAIGKAAAVALPEEIRQWSGAMGLDPAIVPAQLYRAFARSPTALTQACATGSAQSCWTAFGDMDPAADAISTWLTPAEQRAHVAQQSGSPRRTECLAGVETSCRELVVEEFAYRGGMPYSVSLRADLLWFALERGGAGSVDRLHASVEAQRGSFPERYYARGETDAAHLIGAATDIEVHLARAAGMDADVLVELWRQDVMSGRPGAPAPDERSRASTLLWIMLFVGLATRSTRWRLG